MGCEKEDDLYQYECLNKPCNENTNDTVDNGSCCASDIIQCDGGNSINSSTNNDSVSNEFDFEDDVETDSEEEDDGDNVEWEDAESAGVVDD